MLRAHNGAYAPYQIHRNYWYGTDHVSVMIPVNLPYLTELLRKPELRRQSPILFLNGARVVGSVNHQSRSQSIFIPWPQPGNIKSPKAAAGKIDQLCNRDIRKKWLLCLNVCVLGYPYLRGIVTIIYRLSPPLRIRIRNQIRIRHRQAPTATSWHDRYWYPSGHT